MTAPQVFYGDYDFGVIAGSMHMARVSRHNLRYECLGTYLAMFMWTSKMVIRILHSRMVEIIRDQYTISTPPMKENPIISASVHADYYNYCTRHLEIKVSDAMQSNCNRNNPDMGQGL